MSNIDALLITPPSRLEVYQDLSDDYAAIEPPVWSSLIAKYLIKKDYTAQILDAEAENFTHEQTAKKIISINPQLAIFMIYGQQPSASTQCMPVGKKTCDKLIAYHLTLLKPLLLELTHQLYQKRLWKKNLTILFVKEKVLLLSQN